MIVYSKHYETGNNYAIIIIDSNRGFIKGRDLAKSKNKLDK